MQCFSGALKFSLFYGHMSHNFVRGNPEGHEGEQFSTDAGTPRRPGDYGVESLSQGEGRGTVGKGFDSDSGKLGACRAGNSHPGPPDWEAL